MLDTTLDSGISFPFAEPPLPGAVVEVAPGVLWLRMSLPYLLDHVNVYLIEDEGGWAAVDTGLGNDACRAAWDAVFSGPLAGQVLTRVICTHYHPDHMGLVGWLTRRFSCPLSITRTEFLITKVLENSVFAANPDFYAARGLDMDAGGKVSSDGHGYLRLMTGLPSSYHRMQAGDSLRVGRRDFTIYTGGGHSPEQAMLYCAADGLFFSADQVLTKISPNISVQAMEPEADALGEYLDSLAELRREIPEDVLVLPGHHVPFRGLHTRVGELQSHHAHRCVLIEQACRVAPRTAAELLPVLFKRQMDSHQTGFAFGETVAHVNYMVAKGDLVQVAGADGVLRTTVP